jgi:hypothetical protein
MSDQTSKLTVEIAQKSTGTGIADTSRDLKGLTNSAQSAQRAAAANAKSVNDLGEAAGKGAAAGRVLSSALDGDVESIGQLSTVVKGFSTLLKTNLIGLLITLGSLAASFAIPMIKGWTATKDKAKEAEDQIKLTKQATDDARKSAEDLGKAQMDILISNIEIVKRTATEADDAFKSLLRRAQEVDDAQRNLDLAKIDADGNATEEQKAARRAAVNTRFDARRAGRPLAEAQVRVQNAGDVLEGTRGQETQALDQVTSARARVKELADERAKIELELSKLRAAYDARTAEILKTTYDGSERQFLLGKNRDATLAAAKPLDARLGIITGPEGAARQEQASGALAEAEKRLAAATAERMKADAELIKQQKELAEIQAQQAKVIPLVVEASRLKAQQDIAAARARDIAAGRTANVTATATPAEQAAADRIAEANRRQGGTISFGAPETVPITSSPERAARDRASALGSVAAGEAARLANDTNNSPALQILAAKAQEAAAALQKNGSVENIDKVLDLLIQLGQGQADITARLKDAETQIKTARTR